MTGILRAENAAKVTEETYRERVARTEPEYGDLLYSREGTYFGIAAEVPRGTRLCLGQRMVLIRPDPSQIDHRYLKYWLNSPQIAGHVHGFRDGSVAERLNLPVIRGLPIFVPPLDEQKAIAATLGSLDDKIEQNRRTSGALERLARAMFRAWFVDFEPVKAKVAGAGGFPSMPREVFDALPTRLVDSEIGPVPEGWTIRGLYDSARFVNGAAFKTVHFTGDASQGLPVIKIAELKYGLTAQTQYSNRSDLSANRMIDTGDLLYSWSGSPDTSLDTFLWIHGPGFLNQHIFKVITESDSQKHFVYFLLKSLRERLVEIARDKQTTGLGHVTVEDMRRLLISWPCERVFAGFEVVAGPLFELSVSLSLESKKLSEIRDYLLPRLLSGEARVGEAERSVTEAGV